MVIKNVTPKSEKNNCFFHFLSDGPKMLIKLRSTINMPKFLDRPSWYDESGTEISLETPSYSIAGRYFGTKRTSSSLGFFENMISTVNGSMVGGFDIWAPALSGGAGQVLASGGNGNSPKWVYPTQGIPITSPKSGTISEKGVLLDAMFVGSSGLAFGYDGQFIAMHTVSSAQTALGTWFLVFQRSYTTFLILGENGSFFNNSVSGGSIRVKATSAMYIGQYVGFNFAPCITSIE